MFSNSNQDKIQAPINMVQKQSILICKHADEVKTITVIINYDLG